MKAEIKKILKKYKNEEITLQEATDYIEALASKPKQNSSDFIDSVLEVFRKEYYDNRGYQFYVTNKGKERTAIGKLIKLYKSEPENKLKNSDQTLEDMRKTFRVALQIRDRWHWENMSPSHLYSNFNSIKNKINYARHKQREKFEAINNSEYKLKF